VAAGSLRANKLRTFLTLLGVILATATLIAVMSVIEGMNRFVADNVVDMGADGYRIRQVVLIGDWDPKKYLEMKRKSKPLNEEEFLFLKDRITLSREFGLEASGHASVRFGKEALDGVSLTGCTSNIAALTNTEPAFGRFLSDIEDQKRQLVAFIGDDIRQKFFPGVDPVGKTIEIDGRPFQVIGSAKALGSVFGTPRDTFVMIPVHTYFKMFGARKNIGFNAQAIDRAHLYQAQDEVRALLRAHRHLRPKQPDTFAIYNWDAMMEAWDVQSRAVASTAIAIVSVFMLVGGVVIMNIMLAVVTERTHEIGIRKSVGASRRDILKQFLIESSMMSAAGGLIGVFLAWVVAVVVRSYTPVPTAVPASAVLVGVGLATLVGLFFGIYPAQRAARLDPIEALRAEK
jgi:putative ABC transport system permease protein